jgi:uncharacterized protein YecE (DUF72 family)
MQSLFVGTSGYSYKHWKGIFYPDGLAQKRWLAFYSQHFATVEINATFYGSFKEETFAKWRQEVGDDFTFTLKGTRYLTHLKRLVDPAPSIEQFFDPARGLGPAFSCVCWQFAKDFRCDEETLERLRSFLPLLPRDVRQAVEFRDPSWFTDSVYELLRQHNTGWVINDSPHFPSTEVVTADFVYVRFHGPDRLYASSYSLADLKVWAETISRFLESHDVYGYFNNDYHGFAIANARDLIELVRG